MSVYVIAEAGINHNGSMAKAYDLIGIAKRAGADAVKFQTYITDDICRKDNPEHGWLKKCELSYSQFAELQTYCKQYGIDFISTPDTVQDAEFLDTLNMPYMKIGSANANFGFLETLQHIKTPLIISCGMWLKPLIYCPNAACWMHCVSAYPCPVDQANMRVVDDCAFSGFSDHTLGSLCAIMAVARGARFIEKHFTYDQMADGPDHRMSADPDDLLRYVKDIRRAESALGDGVRRVMPCEQKTIDQLKARK